LLPFLIDFYQAELFWIEGATHPLQQFFMGGMIFIFDRFQKFTITPNPTDIFWRTVTFAFDANGNCASPWRAE
jgi:hypothetical protein